MEADCDGSRGAQARPRGALLLYRLVAMIADLGDLGGLDAARVVAFVTPLRRLVAAATFLIFRGGWRGSRGRFIGGEKADRGEQEDRKVSHALASYEAAAADKRKQKGPDECPAL